MPGQAKPSHAIWLKHAVYTYYACIIDGKVFVENFSFDYLSVISDWGDTNKDYTNSEYSDRAKKNF